MACIMPCVVDAHGHSQSDTLPGQPSYIQFVSSDDSICMSDEDFCCQAGSVLFPVSQYNLPAGAPILEELSGSIIPRLKNDSLELLQIWMGGFASPEGPYDSNVRLSEERVKSLLDFLNQQLDAPVDAGIITRKYDDIEGYHILLWLMRRVSDPDSDEVAHLVESHWSPGNNDSLKKRLMRLQDGKLWQRLRKEYFPQLRAARIMLWLRKPTVPHNAVTAPSPIAEISEDKTAEVPDSASVLQEEPSPQILCIPQREMLSVKTNLLFDVAWMPGYNRWCPIPNVAIEYYPKHGHFTYGASLDFPWWHHYGSHKFFEIRNYQLESRYYLRSGDTEQNPAGTGAAYRGFYLQGYVHANVFEIGFNADKGWKGEGFGLGLGAGYVMPISRSGHWRLEFALQAGWYTCRYDPFQYENLINPNYHDGLYYYSWTGEASDFEKRQHKFNWFGPTRIGITLSYDLLYRRQQKRGVGFHSMEERRVGL